MAVARISKEDLKQRLESASDSVQLLDVRLKYPYEHSGVRLPGAVRMTADSLDVSRLARNKDIVVYDSDPDETTSAHVAAELGRQGYRVSVLKGGLAEWMAASFPVENKESIQPAPPAPPASKA